MRYKESLRKLFSVAVTLFMIISSNSFTFADDTPLRVQARNAIRKNWANGLYQKVINPARDYLNEDRRADVAYWLATSLCRTNSKPEGVDWLNEIKNVARKQNILDTLDLEISNCNQLNPPRSFPSQGYVGSLGSMKQIEYAGLSSDVPKGSYLIESDDSIDEKVLARRIISKTNKANALSSVKRSLTYTDKYDGEMEKKDYSTDNQERQQIFRDLYINGEIQSLQVGENFIFTCISCQTHKASDMAAIGLGLEKYIDFFVKEFGMKKPDVFIKIYAVTNNSNMSSLAEQLHGVNLSPYVMGYSIADDMSMVITLPHWNRKLYGTSKHELFHLMIRSDFGNAPPWIEEGMAALYEGSEIKEGKVVGVQNWREIGLRKDLKSRPSIEKLIGMNWMQFNYLDIPEDSPSEYSNTAVLHATARYFILYLERQGKLTEVYKKMREMKITDSFKIIKPDAKTVLEQSLGKSLDAIDKDFTGWFNKLPDITATSVKKSPPKRRNRKR